MQNVNKGELIRALQNIVNFQLAKEKVTIAESSAIFDDFMEYIVQCLSEGNKVSLASLGKFYVSEQKARSIVPPNATTPVEVPAYRVPRFRASSVLKNAVKG